MQLWREYNKGSELLPARDFSFPPQTLPNTGRRMENKARQHRPSPEGGTGERSRPPPPWPRTPSGSPASGVSSGRARAGYPRRPRPFCPSPARPVTSPRWRRADAPWSAPAGGRLERPHRAPPPPSHPGRPAAIFAPEPRRFSPAPAGASSPAAPRQPRHPGRGKVTAATPPGEGRRMEEGKGGCLWGGCPGRAAHSGSVYYPLAVVLLPAVAHRPAAPLLTADPTVPGASALRRGSDAAQRARARAPGPAPLLRGQP